MFLSEVLYLIKLYDICFFSIVCFANSYIMPKGIVLAERSERQGSAKQVLIFCAYTTKLYYYEHSE